MKGTTRTTLAAFIVRAGITSHAKRIKHNPHMEDARGDMSHWRVDLTRARHKMRVLFSMGRMHTQGPTTALVLDTLASEAAGFANAKDFAEWCSAYGYNVADKRPERAYRMTARHAEMLRTFLGARDYDTLLWHTERN